MRLIPHHLIGQLAAIANAAVDHALIHGAPGFVTPPTSEVGYVAAVVRGALRKIAVQWIPILAAAGIRCSITGVFCHQSPRVRFIDGTGTVSTRELADLLIVHDNIGKKGAFTRRAALIQAKMIRGARDAAQQYLYCNWPTFRVRHRAFDYQRPRTFTVHPFLPWLDSGRYGIIDDSGAAPIWRCAVPIGAIAIAGAPALGTFIAEMLNLTLVDRGRLAQPNGNDDWSFTIDELLRITAQRMFKHRATMGPARAPAGSTLQFIPFEYVLVENAQHPELSRVADELMRGYGYDDVDHVIGGDRFDGGGAGDGRRDAEEPEEGPGISTIRILTQRRE